MKKTSHKRNIRLASLLLALLLLLTLTACGKEEPGAGVADDTGVVQIADPAAFLGIAAEVSEPLDENGAMETVFWLNDECEPLCKEYVNALLQSGELTLLQMGEKVRENSTSELFYLGYTGSADIPQLAGDSEGGPACHVLVDIFYAPSISAIRLSVLHAGGLAFTDLGARGDTAAYDSVAYDGGEEESTTQPVTPTVPNGPVFPDLGLFLHRGSDSDDPDSGGRYIAFRGVPDTYADTLLNELYALLTDSRYHLEPAGFEEAELTENVYRTDYLFDYTGPETIEEVTYDRIGTLYALRVMFVHYEKEHRMTISFHFSDEFVLTDSGVVTSVKDTGTPDSADSMVLDNLGDLSGGGSSGGSNGGSGGGGGGSDVAPGYDPYIPDASKLPCLTCGGDGDCNSCGGYGYKFKNDIRSDCTRCTGGNCPACGGSGTR